METETSFAGDYGPRRLNVELANICNLHCSYCFRAGENLYSSHAEFFPIELLRRVIAEARSAANITRINFTGGEPTLHPDFSETLRTIGEAGLTTSFVTNGWHFDRVWPAIQENRAAVSHVAFSLDGVTREDHDRWRGNGSFDRLVRAFSRCYMSKLPFAMKIVIRRDLVDQLEQIAIFAARMGAASLHFVHVMPTSNAVADDSALSLEEQRVAEEEIAILARIFKMEIGIDVGYYNIDETRPPCAPLAGTSMNIDYRGRLSLCCNLSGFRGAAEEQDVIADLNVESFASAYAKFLSLVALQVQRRKDALATLRAQAVTPDVFTGSPCMFCLQSFNKIPWHNRSAGASPSS
ncbi:MAG TPA: radical SAM protein [Pyrinomonadaceae bacterium]|jgi:sulfatase maturation enzyme AslB (radical SAM superfamily)|nr:radical SAM protein [Pyrinomonadaceae bacterium]